MPSRLKPSLVAPVLLAFVLGGCGGPGAPATSQPPAAQGGASAQPPPPFRHLHDELETLYPWTTIEGAVRIGADGRHGTFAELDPQTTLSRKLGFRATPGRALLVRTAMRAREGKPRVRWHLEGDTAEKTASLAGHLDSGSDPPRPMREMVDLLLPVPAALHGKRLGLVLATDLGVEIQYLDVREIEAAARWYDVPFPFIVDQAGKDAVWSVRYRIQCLTPDLTSQRETDGCRVVQTLGACNVHDRPFMGKRGADKPLFDTIGRPDNTGFIRFDDASRCKDEPAR